MSFRCYVALGAVAPLLAISLFGQPYPLRPDEQPPAHEVNLEKITNLSGRLSEMRAKYTDNKIDPRSEDYALLKRLQNHPEVSATVIPELIELSNVLEPKPLTTEPFFPMALSPAGHALVVVGDRAEVPIRQKLENKDVDPQMRAVLEKALAHIAGIRRDRAEKAKRKSDREQSLQNARELTLPKTGEQGEIRGTAGTSSPVSATAKSHDTPAARPWLWAGAGVVLLVLVFLALRQRRKSPRL